MARPTAVSVSHPTGGWGASLTWTRETARRLRHRPVQPPWASLRCISPVRGVRKGRVVEVATTHAVARAGRHVSRRIDALAAGGSSVSEMIREFGIEFVVPGRGRGVYASNFRCATEAQDYIDSRIDNALDPQLVVRMATPRTYGHQPPEAATEWQPYRLAFCDLSAPPCKTVGYCFGHEPVIA